MHLQEPVYEMMHVGPSVISFKSTIGLKSLFMRKIIAREDKAVSPIIATVLLVGITVTMVATAYSLMENYIPSPAPQTPTASVKVVYDNIPASGPYNGNYSVYINSLDGNVSVQDVNVVVTMSNSTILEFGLNQVYAGSNPYQYNSYLNLSLQSSSGYLTSTSMIKFHLADSSSYISRIALVDTLTDGAIVSSLITQ